MKREEKKRELEKGRKIWREFDPILMVYVISL
jgi:hypothetical protein